MKRDDPDILDLLAAEFVLGTLQGAARLRFLRWRDSDAFVERRVRAWEERLAGLVFRVEAVAPPPAVWSSIEQRIGPAMRGRWRALAAATIAAVVLGLGWFLWQERDVPPQAQAVISDSAGTVLWQVAFAADGAHVDVVTLGDVRYPDRRSLELWALPAEAAPVSLGLMPASGSARLALDDRQRAALGVAANVAVSEEPPGGSPTGAPTGPVLYVASLVRT
jgi:anti-sigma-K factor RskA